jgi:hypothetical protein
MACPLRNADSYQTVAFMELKALQNTYSLKLSNFPLMSHLNPVHIFQRHLSKIRFNILSLEISRSIIICKLPKRKCVSYFLNACSVSMYLKAEFIRGHKQGFPTYTLVGKKLNFYNYLSDLTDLSYMVLAEAGPWTSSSSLRRTGLLGTLPFPCAGQRLICGVWQLNNKTWSFS